MNTALRAALAAAIALPLAAPAAASTLVPISPVYHQFGNGVSPAKALFQRIHAHRNAGKVSHFTFPYGLGIDGSGNVYVADVDANRIEIINPDYKVLSNAITTGVSSPVSVATDTYGDVYVGNVGNGGTVTKYNSNFSLVQTITANTSSAYSIAVDQAQDLYLVTGSGLAVDDPYGNSISSDIFGGPELFSVAIGGPNVYTFFDATAAFGDTSVALRGLTLQYEDGPLFGVEPAGAACAATQSLCWTTDAGNNALDEATLPGSSVAQGLGYEPVGIAYDPVRNRIYVADPVNKAVHVYTATTLASLKTIT